MRLLLAFLAMGVAGLCYHAEASAANGGQLIIAQSDADRDAAQRELEEELRRSREQSRQECERQKADSLSSCTAGASSVNQSCQSGCDSIEDPAGNQDCRRACSETETNSRNQCFDQNQGVMCN